MHGRERCAEWASRWRLRLGFGLLAAAAGVIVAGRHEVLEKRVRVVEEGGLVRGAWQRPGPLRRIIRREGIRTIVTLTAINRDDPKYVDQEKVVRRAGTGWIIVPMRGSRATLEQMAEAADLLADPRGVPSSSIVSPGTIGPAWSMRRTGSAMKAGRPNAPGARWRGSRGPGRTRTSAIAV